MYIQHNTLKTILLLYTRLGESCSHIGALLFKIEMAVRLGYTQVAVTDKPCSWNNDFVKKIEGERIENINFYKSKKPVVKKNAKKRYHDSTKSEQNKILKELSELPAKEHPVALSLFTGYSASFHHKAAIPKKAKISNSLRDFYSADTNLTAINIDKIKNLKYSKEDIDYIYRNALLSNSSDAVFVDASTKPTFVFPLSLTSTTSTLVF